MASEELKKKIARYLARQFILNNPDDLPQDECDSEAEEILKMVDESKRMEAQLGKAFREHLSKDPIAVEETFGAGYMAAQRASEECIDQAIRDRMPSENDCINEFLNKPNMNAFKDSTGMLDTTHYLMRNSWRDCYRWLRSQLLREKI